MSSPEQTKFVVAMSLHARARGLLGRSAENFDGVLILVPCRSVHTFGMRFAIDVAFANRSGAVIRTERRVSPCRVLCCRKAYYTAERPSCEAIWFKVGDQLPLQFC